MNMEDTRKELHDLAFSGDYDGFSIEFNLLEIIASANHMLKNQEDPEILKDRLSDIKSLVSEIEAAIYG